MIAQRRKERQDKFFPLRSLAAWRENLLVFFAVPRVLVTKPPTRTNTRNRKEFTTDYRFHGYRAQAQAELNQFHTSPGLPESRDPW